MFSQQRGPRYVLRALRTGFAVVTRYHTKVFMRRSPSWLACGRSARLRSWRKVSRSRHSLYLYSTLALDVRKPSSYVVACALPDACLSVWMFWSHQARGKHNPKKIAARLAANLPWLCRCAMRLARRLDARGDPTRPTVYVLRGGFTGFVRQYRHEHDLVDGLTH
jgi:hypothetical protein